jgi:hypothetical protein
MTIYKKFKEIALSGLAALVIGVTSGCAKDKAVREYSPESETIATEEVVQIEVPETPAINMSNAYVKASVSTFMPLGSNDYNKAEPGFGVSAGVINNKGLEFNVGADVFNSKAHGDKNGAKWSADSDYMLASAGVRKNFTKQGITETHIGGEFDILVANSRFKVVGGGYDNVDETDSSITYGLGFNAGVSVGKKVGFGIRYIHLFKSDSVQDIFGISAGYNF